MKLQLIASAFALALLSSMASAQTGVEYGTDRPGSDIVNFNLHSAALPQNCQGACQANASCRAWTFVRAGYQAAVPRCWLKNAIPAPQNSYCCVSGVK